MRSTSTSRPRIWLFAAILGGLHLAGTAATPEPLFKDVSDLLNGVHFEQEFDDFDRQPLLARKLSQNGPGVAWLDINSDGRDDVLLGSGRGGTPRAWLNDGKGGFTAIAAPAWNHPSPGDQTAIVGALVDSGRIDFFVGCSGYESSSSMTNAILHYSVSFDGVKPGPAFAVSENIGPLALADFDGDGDLDLFAGGQTIPAQYPRSAGSQIYRQQDGRFAFDPQNSSAFAAAGLVNGAVWSDVTNDGFPELILACEWGPVRLYRNDRGTLVDATRQFGLESIRGWWNGVTTGDLDGDGKLEIIATNWGRNTKYQSFVAGELRLYHADFDQNGSWEIVEAYFDPELRKEVPWRDFRIMSQALPRIRERFQTYASYAAASVQDILAPDLEQASRLTATTLDSMVFWNRTNSFEASPLPLHAQFAPAFAAVVTDFDGDGHEDLFLSQNFFAVDAETGRLDGGRGLWLKSDGHRGFRPMSWVESGVEVLGEQRGAAVCDYNADGRTDLLVAQNAAPLRLFKNQSAKPGLRLRLVGARGNIGAIGAQVALKFESGIGPVREIHGGSGYWSQDSTTLVLAKPSEPTGIWVRWPGGRTTELPLPPGASEVEVHHQTGVRVTR